jgi:hypothetical protein
MLAPSKSLALATISTILLGAASGSVAAGCAGPALCDTNAEPMMKTSERSIDPVFTVGESIKG